MPAPYPRELRDRVVTAYNNGEGTYEELADRFQVGRATVDRWLGLERTTGSVAPLAMGGARHAPMVDAAGEEYIRELLDLMPDSTLRELADGYEERFGVRMHERTMGRSVARMGLTRKRGL
jgi:transposase